MYVSRYISYAERVAAETKNRGESIVKSFGNAKKTKKLIFRDVVAQGPSVSRRIKNVDGYFFPRAMLMLRETARKTGDFPEQANCHREFRKKRNKTKQNKKCSGGGAHGGCFQDLEIGETKFAQL